MTDATTTPTPEVEPAATPDPVIITSSKLIELSKANPSSTLSVSVESMKEMVKINPGLIDPDKMDDEMWYRMCLQNGIPQTQMTIKLNESLNRQPYMSLGIIITRMVKTATYTVIDYAVPLAIHDSLLLYFTDARVYGVMHAERPDLPMILVLADDAKEATDAVRAHVFPAMIKQIDEQLALSQAKDQSEVGADQLARPAPSTPQPEAGADNPEAGGEAPAQATSEAVTLTAGDVGDLGAVLNSAPAENPMADPSISGVEVAPVTKIAS